MTVFQTALAPFTLKGFYLLTWGSALGSNVWNIIVRYRLHSGTILTRLSLLLTYLSLRRLFLSMRFGPVNVVSSPDYGSTKPSHVRHSVPSNPV